MAEPFSKSSTRKLIVLAGRPDGVTIADVMRTRICTMREAIARLRAAETTGRIERTGGAPGTAFRWSTPAAPLPAAAE